MQLNSQNLADLLPKAKSAIVSHSSKVCPSHRLPNLRATTSGCQVNRRHTRRGVEIVDESVRTCLRVIS